MPKLEAQATEYGFYFQVEIKEADGSPFNLTGAISISLRAQPKGSSVPAALGSTAISGAPTDGIVRTTIAQGELAQGNYDAQYKIEFATRTIITKLFQLEIGSAL